MPADLIQLMQQLNFSLPVARVYEILLKNGPLSPDLLSSLTGQPKTHLDQSIEALMSLQLIAKDYVRSRPAFYARDPTIAWLALEADLVWETDTSLLPARLVPTTGNRQQDELREKCVEVVTLARTFYKPHAAALSHKVRDANTPDELMRLTCELLYHASEHIHAVSKSPRLPHVAQFWTVLTGRIEKGVRYRRIADLEEVIDHGLSVVTRDMNVYNIDLRILESDSISHSFYLVDDRYLATHHYKSKGRDKSQRGFGRITNQPQIVGRYKKRFLNYVARSIPGKFVVSHLRDAAEELLLPAGNVFSADQIEWMEDLINVGKFSRFHKTRKWSQKKIEETERTAMEHSLVRKNHEGFLVPNYPSNERKIRNAFVATSQYG